MKKIFLLLAAFLPLVAAAQKAPAEISVISYNIRMAPIPGNTAIPAPR